MTDFCVVTEPCRDCKYTDCVTVCPVDCFYQDERMLYIDTDTCIGCEACIDECPVGAIYAKEYVPSQWQHYIELNLERATALKASDGNITQKQPPLLGAGCTKA